MLGRGPLGARSHHPRRGHPMRGVSPSRTLGRACDGGHRATTVPSEGLDALGRGPLGARSHHPRRGRPVRGVSPSRTLGSTYGGGLQATTAPWPSPFHVISSHVSLRCPVPWGTHTRASARATRGPRFFGATPAQPLRIRRRALAPPPQHRVISVLLRPSGLSGVGGFMSLTINDPPLCSRSSVHPAGSSTGGDALGWSCWGGAARLPSPPHRSHHLTLAPRLTAVPRPSVDLTAVTAADVRAA